MKRNPDFFRKFYLLPVLLLLVITGESWCTEMVSMAVHIDTNVSGGRYSVAETAEFLEEKGIDGAVFTDHDNAEITYGLYPFRQLIKKTMSFPSIETYGRKRYLEDIRDASRLHPDLLLIPGAEAVPFYYWEGSYLMRDLTLMNWQEHMLVVGMTEPSHYAHLPSIHRGFGEDGVFRVSTLFLPVGLGVAGVYLVRKRVERKFHFDRFTYTTVSRWPRVPGFLVLGLAGLVLIKTSPFDAGEIDQYHGSRGSLPYQKLINYANSVDALTFWAHPEASAEGTYEGVRYETKPYHRHLLETAGYDGFAIFWSGDREIGSPGGIWDQVLRQYTEGIREKPVWAIGELDWEGVGGSDLLDETLTLCFPEERSVAGVLTSMKNGRMVAARSGVGGKIKEFEFHVSSESGESAGLGDEIVMSGLPLITFRLEHTANDNLLSEIQLIRNGVIISDSTLLANRSWEFRDSRMPSPGELWYYRIVVGKGFPVVATNPIFVRGAQPEGNERLSKDTGA